MTGDQMREILGHAANGKTDKQLEKYIAELQTVASDMYDHLIGITEGDKVQDIRWAAYLHDNDFPTEQDDQQFWVKYGAEASTWP
jgi:hypothetical protein